MEITPELIEQIAEDMDVSSAELAKFVALGEKKTYPKGDYLFHESAPRRWFGIVLEGKITLQRGLSGRSLTIAHLAEGAVIGEGLFVEDLSHSVSGLALDDTVVWAVSRASIEEFREAKPEIFFRMVRRAARRISYRLRETTDLLLQADGNRNEYLRASAGARFPGDPGDFRSSLLRSADDSRGGEFPLSGIRLSHFQHLVNGFAYVKKAAAEANAELGVLDASIAEAIGKACDRIIAGELHEHFVVDMVQGGAGTSSNMNANEVIANCALEILGHRKGEYQYCHPNDHVNCSQSTNDVYPTAVKLAVVSSLLETTSALRVLKVSFQQKAEEFSDVIKMGRTENQDAVPMTLGQEFAAYAIMVNDGIRRLLRTSEELLVINMGATAIGTGLNSPRGYAELCHQKLFEMSGLEVKLAEDLVEATQDAGDFASMSSALKVTALQISKICNDLRWASSGPRCGLDEINLPALQPGSSIMPGKVNPVIPEVVNQICYQIIGSDLTVSMAAEASEFELNMAEPIMVYNLLSSMMLLKNGAVVLSTRCVNGITANRERCANYVKNSIGIVTALSPELGYERSASIAKEALATGQSIYDLVLEKKWMNQDELDDLLRPEKMANPLSHD